MEANVITSMTGHGEAAVENGQIRVVVEIRSVNNRFLKINISSDLGSAAEAKVESIIKDHVLRGSVSVRIRTTDLDVSRRYRLNAAAIRAYWLQLSEIAESSQSVKLESVLQLPGVVEESRDDSVAEASWPVIAEAVVTAARQLDQMRQVEGQAMKADLLENTQRITAHLGEIKQRSPEVARSYSQRLSERINQALAEHDASVSPSDIVREVAIFADRCDVSEETVRLDSHLEQFAKALDEGPGNGKKLDFLVQEMLRETNTIGSKANDAPIAQEVVAIKTAIERIREMVQNIE